MQLNQFPVSESQKAKMLDYEAEFLRRFKQGTYPPAEMLDAMKAWFDMRKVDPQMYYAQQALAIMPEETDEQIYQKIEATLLYYKYFATSADDNRAICSVCQHLAEKFHRKYWLLKYRLDLESKLFECFDLSFEEFAEFGCGFFGNKDELSVEEKDKLEVTLELEKVERITFRPENIERDKKVPSHFRTRQACDAYQAKYYTWLVGNLSEAGVAARNKARENVALFSEASLKDLAKYWIAVFEKFGNLDDFKKAKESSRLINSCECLLSLAEVLIAKADYARALSLLTCFRETLVRFNDHKSATSVALVEKFKETYWCLRKGVDPEGTEKTNVDSYKEFVGTAPWAPQNYLFWLPLLDVAEVEICLSTHWGLEMWQQAYVYVSLAEKWLSDKTKGNQVEKSIKTWLEKAFSLVMKPLEGFDALDADDEILINKIELLGRIYKAKNLMVNLKIEEV